MARLYKDLSEFEKLALIDMSYSRIDCYGMCPAKYFYKYISKEDEVFGAAGTLGNIVHDVLEDHVGEDELDASEFLKSFYSYREDYDPDHIIGQELIEAAETMILEFVDRHEPEDFGFVHSKEMNFEIVIGTALVRGFIDRVDYVDEGPERYIHITDWKTGRWEVAQKNVSENLQLGIYVIATALLFPEVDTFKAELYYLRSGKRKAHTFQRSDVADVESRVQKEMHKIIHDLNYSATKNGRVCSFCDFASWDLCKIGARRNQQRLPR